MCDERPETALRLQRVNEMFARQAALAPHAIAVEAAGAAIPYGVLATQARTLAAHLRHGGVRPGQLVGLFLDRSPDMIMAVLATLEAGAGYLPLDASYPAERLAFMLADAAPAAILTHSSLEASLPPHHSRVIALDRELPPLPDAIDAANQGGTPDDCAYLIYTSGSTGKPKGVVMHHRPLVNLLHWQRETLPLHREDRVLQFSPLGFDVSFQEIGSTLTEGGTLVLMRDDLRRDPDSLLRYLAEHRITRLYLPFVALQQLADAAAAMHPAPALCLKDVITAGEQLQITEAIRIFFRKLPAARLHNHYGPTETHVVTAHTLEGPPDAWPVLPPIGRPVHRTRINIFDTTSAPVAAGEPGELFIAGDCVARGYLNRPDITAQRFLDDPAEPGARMYRTGDLGRLLPDGAIEYLGRADDQVKIRGHRVELGEVENHIRNHPGVANCAVVAQARGAEKVLVAHVVTRDGGPVPADQLRAHLLAHLPDAFVPSWFVASARLPLTPSGKVDRRALPVVDGALPPSRPALPPESELERRILAVWEGVLGFQGISVLESFFAVGGTSLLMAEVQRKLRTALERDLPITLLFQHPTIRQLASALSAPTASSGAARSEVNDRAARQREAAARLAATRGLRRSP